MNSYVELKKKQEKELQDKIKEDKVGDKFIYDMFLYEMANHEYIISLDIRETLQALNLTLEDVMNDKALTNGLILAKEEYFRSYEVM